MAIKVMWWTRGNTTPNFDSVFFSTEPEVKRYVEREADRVRTRGEILKGSLQAIKVHDSGIVYYISTEDFKVYTTYNWPVVEIPLMEEPLWNSGP